MPETQRTAFISYSREDSEFALRLARDLKAAGASVWIDQLDITAGAPWDNAIEDALLDAPQMLVVLTPASSHSSNVRNEISFALDQGKIVVPVIHKDCIVPLQLQRNNRIDFRADYARGLSALLDHLRVVRPNQHVLDQAAEDEAVRKTVWQAREAESLRLAELKEREEEIARRKDASERVAIQEAGRKLNEQARQKVSERGEGKPNQEKRRPAFLLRNPKLTAAISIVACIALTVQVAARHWSSRAGVEWTPLNSGTKTDLNVITGSIDGKILFTCGLFLSAEKGGPVTTVLLRSTDGGASWVELSRDAPISPWLILSASDGSRLWSPGGPPYTIWISNDSGESWSSASTPNWMNSGELHAMFRASDARRLWAAGDNAAILASDNGGATWTWALQPDAGVRSLSSISGTGDGSFLITVGEGGIIYVSHNGGIDWQARSSGPQDDLSSVFVSSGANLICAVGELGTIVVSFDKGVTWARRHSGTTQALERLFGTSDGSHLWAVGSEGSILESDDSGATWAQRTSHTKTDLAGIFGTSDGKLLWVTGVNGTILESRSSFF